jgi:hypothetical protein
MKFISGLLTCLILFVCKTQQKVLIWKTTEDSLTVNPLLFVSGVTFLESYDKQTNEISLRKLGTNSPSLSVVPRVDFKNDNIGDLIQFDIYKSDSIFVVTENSILIVNDSGQIIYNRNLLPFVKDNEGIEVVFWDNSNQYPLYFDSLRKELYLKTTCSCYFMEPKYFARSIEAKLNILSGKIDFLPYTFPERYRHNFYGQAVFPFREINDSLNIVSFQNEDSLYVFNRETNRLKSYKCKSHYQQANFIPFDTVYKNDLERIKEHLIVSPMYQKILYDKYKKVYYRFFWKEQSLKDSNGVYRGIFDRDLIIMVLNEDFRILGEKNIGHSYLWYYSYVSQKGLHIRKAVNDKSVRLNQKYEYFTIFSFN